MSKEPADDLTLNDYQREAARTFDGKWNTPVPSALCSCALGVTGEGGELAELVKKHVFHDRPLNVAELQKEAGDVLWYLAALCTVIGVDLGDVAQGNLEKLRKRYPDGFSSAASAARVDVEKLAAETRRPGGDEQSSGPSRAFRSFPSPSHARASLPRQTEGRQGAPGMGRAGAHPDELWIVGYHR